MICFSIPITGVVDFEHYFPSQRNEVMRRFLKECTIHRNAMQTSLRGIRGNPDFYKVDDLITRIKEYLPFLWTFIQRLEASHPVYALHRLWWRWESILARTSAMFEIDTYLYELTMVGHVLAVAYLYKAKFENRIEIDRARTAVSYLKEAASWFRFVTEHVLSKWTDVPKEIPPEVNATIARGMQDYAAAEAYAIMFESACQPGSSFTYTLRAQIAMGASSKFCSFRDALQCSEIINVQVYQYAHLNVVLYYLHAVLCMAQEYSTTPTHKPRYHCAIGLIDMGLAYAEGESYAWGSDQVPIAVAALCDELKTARAAYNSFNLDLGERVPLPSYCGKLMPTPLPATMDEPIAVAPLHLAEYGTLLFN